MTVEPTADPRGLRERKKQLTRFALVRAALELFTAQGYEQTTVDEIAEAVEVSQRTFFRYFASKEDVAFAIQSQVEARFAEAVRARPPGEGPFEAMRNAALAGMDTIDEAVGETVPVELHLRSYGVIESTPALIAAHLRRSVALEEQVARLIADREGLDVGADPRPRTTVAAFGGVMRVAGRMWAQGDDWSLEALRELTARYLDSLGPALTAGWQTGGAETPDAADAPDAATGTTGARAACG